MGRHVYLREYPAELGQGIADLVLRYPNTLKPPVPAFKAKDAYDAQNGRLTEQVHLECFVDCTKMPPYSHTCFE